jgi:small-conductance mechanosensitive channel
MNAKEIAHYIRFTPWTNSDLRQFVEAVKFARAQLTRQNIWSVGVGDAVSFNSSKLGFVSGTVEKVAIKYVTVRTPRGLYRVPANMLEQQRAVA